MTGPEMGFLLLTARLGRRDRKPLTPAQLRNLAVAVRSSQRPEEDAELTESHLVDLGYTREAALHILNLLSERELLDAYLRRSRDCVPVTRVSEAYPLRVRQHLGEESPGVLWMRGDREILVKPRVALAGSRDLRPRNVDFAREAGRQAALQGYVLVSGNARGADSEAQDACLEAGGQVICVVADSLLSHPPRKNVLYLSEDGYEEKFSSLRALSRNRVIHSMAPLTLIPQCSLRKGGTWSGTQRNLRYGWSRVACFDDKSAAAAELAELGALLIGPEALQDLYRLSNDQ